MNNEDVKILEELKNKRVNVSGNMYSVKWFELNEQEKQAIENLIARNKELEEKYKIRKEIYDRDIKKEKEKYEILLIEKELLSTQLKEQILYGNKVTIEVKDGKLPDILTQNYVPKSKVREKIEELNKRFAEPIAKTEKEMSDICYTIKALQSLLED